MTRLLFVPAVAVMIAGCTPVVETRVASTGLTEVGPVTFSVMTEKNRSQDFHKIREMVSTALSKHGFHQAENAPLHLDVALATRPARLALGNATGPGTLSPAKRKKPLQSCEDREYRLGVTLTRISDGAVFYKGIAAEYHCRMLLIDSVPNLLDAALADIGKPRGNYVLKRRARD